MNRITCIIACLTLFLGACAPKAAPTLDAVQIELSAVAQANSFVEQTNAAIPPTLTPTNTPIPSQTPLPTSTATVIPMVVEVSPTVLAADDCNRSFFASPAGSADAGKIDNGANIFITNTTKAPVTVSLFLSKNKYGQCGYVSYALPPMQSVSVVNVLPYGCYFASAYVNDPKKPSRPEGDSACITGPDRTTVTVAADKIKITGP